MSFFNILWSFHPIKDAFADGMYSLTSTIFMFLSNVYSFLVELASSSEFVNSSAIEGFTNTVYVLAGVFMLFRVTVSFLNTLIEPDKFSDKNEGATKILTRVILTVILMIFLYPTGFVYSFLDRLESAIINPNDGLITNLINKVDINVGSVVNKYIDDINPFGDKYASVNAFNEVLIDNTDNIEKCPIRVDNKPNPNKKSLSQIKKSCFFVDTEKQEYYEIDMYEYVYPCWEGYGNLTEITGTVQGDSWYFRTVSGSATSSGKTVTLSNSGITSLDKGTYSFSSVTCPEKMRISGSSAILYSNDSQCAGPECVDGANTIDALYIGQSSGYIDQEAKADEFSQNVLASMTECSPDKSANCKEMKDTLLYSPTDAINYIKDGDMSVSWLPAIIIGIAIVVYLIVLCIEVVVRRLKLLLLQMIAPIAIISYVSPKDKIFNEWVKMYVATYADLFIKLLAISLGAKLIGTIHFGDSLIKNLLLIMGILVFMKVIPTMISKIFNIDIASGSLKDSFNMLKKGAGLAAGAAIGGAASVATGAMAFHATKGQGFGNRLLGAMSAGKNTIGGVVSGAIGGSKGKIGSGLKYSTKNMSAKGNYEKGLTAGGLLMGATLGKVGMDYASYVDRKNINAKDKQKTLDDFTKFKGSIEDTAESSDFTKTLRQKVAAGDLSFEEDEIKKYRDTWAEYQIAENNARQRVISSDSVKENQISLANKVAAGTITQEQADIAQTNFVNSEIMTELEESNPNLIENIKNAQEETGISMEIEGGKQSAIVSAMENANATITGSSTVRGVVGDQKLTSFNELKNANTTAKKEATRIGNEIFASEATDEYQTAKTNREAANGSER